MAADHACAGPIAKDQRRRLDDKRLAGFNHAADLSIYTRKISVRTVRATAYRALLSISRERNGIVQSGLIVGHGNLRHWTDDEVALVRDAAGYTWDAVDRAQATAALREEQRTLATLNEIGTVLAAELNLDRVVQMVTDAGVDLTGAEFGAFFYNVLDQEGGKLHALHPLRRCSRVV